MSLRGWFNKNIEGLRGAWTRVDQKRARPTRASEVRNMRFEPRGPVTRHGHSQFALSTNFVKSMYNWITTTDGVGRINRLVFLEDNVLRMRNLLVAPVDVDLFTLAGRAAFIVEAGVRLYAQIINTDALSAGQVRVVYPLVGGSPADKAFAPPWANTPNIATTGAGDTSPGLHKFGYIIESRSGFAGKFSPVTAGVHVPVEYTVASGGEVLRMSFVANIPDDSAFLHVIMTTIDNPHDWFYVPGASLAIPAGAPAWSISISFEVSDTDLNLVAVKANDNESLLAQDVAGTGPFEPSAIVNVGRRMAYFVNDHVYISDIDDYEVVTEDLHSIFLPGRKQVVTGFSLRGSFYILGPQWTYAVVDNTQEPVYWAAPFAVSGQHGTIAPFGVTTRTSGDFAWVANTLGLYMFDGQYAPVPISYMNKPEWDRINWNAPAAITVIDDVANQRVRVVAPLDDATEPSHILTWHYTNGLDPFQVDFSLDDFAVGEFGCAQVIQHPTTRRNIFLIGPIDSTDEIWGEDETAKDDTDDGITSVYETGIILTRADRQDKINRFGGFDVAVRGAGLLTSIIKALGRTTVFQAGSIILEETPDDEPQRWTNLTSENATIRFSTSGAGSWFDLSLVKVYWKRWLKQR